MLYGNLGRSFMRFHVINWRHCFSVILKNVNYSNSFMYIWLLLSFSIVQSFTAGSKVAKIMSMHGCMGAFNLLSMKGL